MPKNSICQVPFSYSIVRRNLNCFGRVICGSCDTLENIHKKKELLLIWHGKEGLKKLREGASTMSPSFMSPLHHAGGCPFLKARVPFFQISDEKISLHGILDKTGVDWRELSDKHAGLRVGKR